MKNLKMMALAAIAVIALNSCSDDDKPQAVIENEVITTVTATFTPAGGGTAIVLKSVDADGDGPLAPVVTVSGPFAAGAQYAGRIAFLNETVSPAEDITEEIEAEGDHHQLFYQHSGLGSFTYADTDEDGRPIGVHFNYTAAASATSGNLTVTLVHHPEKTAEGVSSGNIANAGGSTDAEVVFPVTIQ